MWTKVWVAQLDQPTGSGGGLARIKKLHKLTPEEDPKNIVSQ
jgi:hypothetical protein